MVDSVELETRIMLNSMVVSNPAGGLTYLSMVCRELKLFICGVEFLCNDLGFRGMG